MNDSGVNDSGVSSSSGPQHPAPGKAVEKHSSWGGWIWVIPIAALLIVGYLAITQWLKSGPEVTVTFSTAGGVKPSNTQVQYEGLQVGEVESVTLHKDLQHVDVVLQLNADMKGHLGPGTRFWIAGENPSLSNIGSLKSVLTGPFIGVEPHTGPQQPHYEGLQEPPVEKELVPGTRFSLHAPTLGTVSRGSSIYYRDLQVGSVESRHLNADGKSFDIVAFIQAPYDHLVHTGTRFWNAGAVQVSMAASGPRLQMQSLPSLLAGAIDFETPDNGTAGPPAHENESFPLYPSRSQALNTPDARSVRYHVTFSAADAGDLDDGAPVTLASKRVGSVVSSALQYDPGSGQLASQVTIALNPADISLAGGDTWKSDPGPQMNDLMKHLIAQGLRASVGHTIPVVGSPAVQLSFVPNAREASLSQGPIPEIPTGPGSDISGLMASISGVGAKIDAMPLDQIADDVHQTTQRLAALSNSEQLKSTLQHLDQTVANVDAVTREARGRVGPLLAQLHAVADQADSAVAAARGLLNSSGTGQTAPETAGLGHALYEVTRAARSLRELADFLDRHPEALLRGRG